MTVNSNSESSVAGWRARGHYRMIEGHSIFTVVVSPTQEETLEPLLILHGFPTSSFDFHLVVDTLARNRHVFLFDMLGFGSSAKPDLRYSIELQADIVELLVSEAVGVAPGGQSGHGGPSPRFALLTHDMGDTVGGELLARQMEGRWPVEITRRVVTNGSIYIEMAHLTDGQNFLLALPDERLAAPLDPSGETLVEALRATLSPRSPVARGELEAAAELIATNGGDTLLPRLIRYIEDRRQKESRYTGAIEGHPSPLAIVWGTDDPIAVVDMASRLHSVRPESSLVMLQGVGHYPMLESPALFAEAVESALC